MYFSHTLSFSCTSRMPIILMLVCLMLSQRSLRLLISFYIFSLSCSASVISTILSSSSLIHSSISNSPLVVASSILFTLSYCVVHFWLSIIQFFQVLIKHFLQLLDPCFHFISQSLDHLSYQYSEFFSRQTAYFLFICFVFSVSTIFLHLLHISLSFYFIYFIVFGVSFWQARKSWFLLIVESVHCG